MADREVDIRFRTTGSTKAAADAKKVAAATGAAGKAADTAGKKTGAMGAKVQQAGYQIGDFAVQVGAGQSALTAFAQQGSQLLGAFGAGGAIAGALLAVGAAVARAAGQSKDATDDVDEALANLGDRLKEVQEKGEAMSLESALAEFEAFVSGINQQSEAIRKQNEAIGRNIQLQRAKRAADMEVVNAQAAADLAEIANDPDLSESEKIRRSAAVRGRVAEAEFQARMAALSEEPQAAQARRSEASMADLDARQKEAELRQKLVELMDEEAALRAKETQTREARVSMDALKKRADELAEVFGPALTAKLVNSAGDPEAEGAARSPQVLEFYRIRRQIAGLDAQRTFSQADARRLVELQGEKDEKGKVVKPGVVARAEDAAEAAAEAVKKTREALEKAAEEARLTAERVAYERQRAKEAFEAQQRARGFGESGALGKLPMYGPENRPDGYGGGVNDAGIQLGGQIGSALGRLGLSREQLAAVNQKLDALMQGGVQSGEAAAVSEMLGKVLQFLEVEGQLKQEDRSQMRTFQARLAQLESRQRNNRD